MDAAETSLGSILRQERLRQNLDLRLIAAQTKICPAILEAIENEQFDSLPGGSYRRSFLRQYARILGMDGDAIIGEYNKQYEEPPLPLPVPPKARRIVCQRIDASPSSSHARSLTA
jgi:cytoskeleton protein RodZ